MVQVSGIWSLMALCRYSCRRLVIDHWYIQSSVALSDGNQSLNESFSTLMDEIRKENLSSKHRLSQ